MGAYMSNINRENTCDKNFVKEYNRLIKNEVGTFNIQILSSSDRM